ncbi:nitrate ABC transporter substrate-binding protein, partial [Bowmanella sp. Y57]|nr:nitrate ABC transporter substrate-binding protein [Bowmanella yangjiangensis]
DDWYVQTAKRVFLPEIYRQAAAELIAEGHAQASDFPPADEDGFREPLADTIDGVVYDGHQPNAYLQQFSIGLKGDRTL